MGACGKTRRGAWALASACAMRRAGNFATGATCRASVGLRRENFFAPGRKACFRRQSADIVLFYEEVVMQVTVGRDPTHTQPLPRVRKSIRHAVSAPWKAAHANPECSTQDRLRAPPAEHADLKPLVAVAGKTQATTSHRFTRRRRTHSWRRFLIAAPTRWHG
jgi:hypothetical protein